MRAIDLLRMVPELLKSLSKIGIRMSDWEWVELYDDYVRLRESGAKVDYVLAVLSEKYGISESTTRRVLRRLCRSVKP